MSTQEIRTGLRAVLDLLAQGHKDILDEASAANSLMVTADEKEDAARDRRCKWAARRLENVKQALVQQGLRCNRLRDEVEQLRKKAENLA